MKYQILHNLSAEYTKSLKARFWAKVDTSGGSNACWEWTAGLNKGYGKIGVKMSYQLAHRVSYELHIGPIPKGLHVLHSCDNPACVNPIHLFIGTNDDNIADKLSKGRQASPRGMKNANAKLTPEAVRDIRENYVPGSQGSRQKYSLRYFARKYKVSHPTILRVVKNEGWDHV